VRHSKQRKASIIAAAFWDSGVGPTKLFACQVRYHSAPTAVAADVHQGYELGVVTSGQVERYFGDETVRLGPGDVWFSAAWEPHRWRAVAPNSQMSAFHFLPQFFGDQVPEGLNWLAVYAAAPEDRPRATSAEMRRVLLHKAEELTREAQEQSRGWRVSVHLGLLQMFQVLTRDWESIAPLRLRRHGGLNDLALVMPAVKLLTAGPPRRITSQEASAVCSLSVSQFRAVFLRAVGVSFAKFCLRARLAHASRLLRTSQLTVAEVAAAADFADAGHLHRAFVAHFGCTPAQHREYQPETPEVW
jgi:AraC-like DNA-binding protein